ncbi:hypothetical protein GCM10025879_13270 [Leuconostoc litchii]|uniref:XRE family transcriptional regulator n=1 Tax=Leuconostoc litchii TaxID=1981069 RepID=A0A6P2CKC2_9LACO|nr:helix-turn-helix domain-containing protein [Leuconostoc litchii]TYC46351.1 XRE family transcriptional regulator [Leuconostoc litchii]GMA70081.1 hypothetical protein GCM10025879_13270 [Leuconostoc litchii]
MEIQFPLQLKKLRTKLEMSQEDVAGKLYISRQAVSRWEAGDATPDMSNLIKLSEIFDCSLDMLVLGIEPTQDNIEDKIDKDEFVFDPRKGKYIRRRREKMNFWEFLAHYWWILIIFFAIFGNTISDVIEALKGF